MKKKIKSWNGNPETEPNPFITEYPYHFTWILEKDELIKEMNQNPSKIKKAFEDETCLKDQKVQVKGYNARIAITINGILIVESKDEEDSPSAYLNAEIALDQINYKLIKNITK